MSTVKPTKKYRVMIGINYPSEVGAGPEVRAEIGDIVDDIPKGAIGWMLDQGIIEEVRQ
jgi:hypothetical protein